MTNFLEDFQKMRFSLGDCLSTSDWISHANIKINDSSNGLFFSRKPGDNTFNYFCALYKPPLSKKCVFKVTVKSLYETDRFIDVGIASKSKFNKIKTNFVNSFSSGGISYCGYSHGGGLTGNYPSTSANSSDGMKPGAHFYLSFQPKKEIKFYNDQKTINLQMSMVNKTEDYFLFCVLYHPQTSYHMEKIE